MNDTHWCDDGSDSHRPRLHSQLHVSSSCSCLLRQLANVERALKHSQLTGFTLGSRIRLVGLKHTCSSAICHQKFSRHQNVFQTMWVRKTRRKHKPLVKQFIPHSSACPENKTRICNKMFSSCKSHISGNNYSRNKNE
jgi:hypothetical protein